MLVNDIARIIRESDLPLDSLKFGDFETKGVFANRVPSELAERTDFTTILVRENINSFTGFAGDHATMHEYRYLIQVWYKHGVNYEDFELALNNLLEDNGFYASQNLGHSIDEETQQVKVELRYNTNKFLN